MNKPHHIRTHEFFLERIQVTLRKFVHQKYLEFRCSFVVNNRTALARRRFFVRIAVRSCWQHVKSMMQVLKDVKVFHSIGKNA